MRWHVYPSDSFNQPILTTPTTTPLTNALNKWRLRNLLPRGVAKIRDRRKGPVRHPDQIPDRNRTGFPGKWKTGPVRVCFLGSGPTAMRLLH
jgi:hypothetical protein